MVSATLTIIAISSICGISASIISVLMGYGAFEVFNVGAGLAVALSPFISWLMIVKITDGLKKKKLLGGILATLKYPLIGGGIWILLKSESFETVFFIVGLSCVIPAIIVGGILWNNSCQKQANIT